MKSKTLIACFLSLSIFSICLGQNNTRINLIGKWEAKDSKGITGSINFIDSVNIIVTIPGQPLPRGTYTINTTKDPFWFDITIKQGKKNLIMKSLLKLINETTLKWQVFLDGNRPNSFIKETSNNTILLKKKA
jgi:hypothetical protein